MIYDKSHLSIIPSLLLSPCSHVQLGNVLSPRLRGRSPATRPGSQQFPAPSPGRSVPANVLLLLLCQLPSLLCPADILEHHCISSDKHHKSKLPEV